jgi:hypothetical protein
MNRKVTGNGSGNMEGNLGVIRRNRLSYFGSFSYVERVWSTSCLFFCGVVLVSCPVYVLRLRTYVFGGTLFGIFLAKVDGSFVWSIRGIFHLGFQILGIVHAGSLGWPLYGSIA